MRDLFLSLSHEVCFLHDECWDLVVHIITRPLLFPGNSKNYITETFKYEAKVLEEHILRHEIIHAVLNLLVKSNNSLATVFNDWWVFDNLTCLPHPPPPPPLTFIQTFLSPCYLPGTVLSISHVWHHLILTKPGEVSSVPVVQRGTCRRRSWRRPGWTLNHTVPASHASSLQSLCQVSLRTRPLLLGQPLGPLQLRHRTSAGMRTQSGPQARWD